MRSSSGIALVLAALLLAMGVAGGGWLAGRGFRDARLGERIVSVKGLAEREVRADLAIWPLRFVATGNDLEQVRTTIGTAETAVRAFVDGAGLRQVTLEVAGLEVTDAQAQLYRSGPAETRFVIAELLVLRSPDVEGVAALAQRVGELIGRNVVLSSEGAPSSGPVYLFTGLNEAKPDMVAEATRNARASAEQFAADSDSRLGGIRRASQGVFQILARDEAPGILEQGQIAKRLRVVSTVEYFLRD